MILIGLMGSGKTTVGRIVAERTGRSMVDVDELIFERTELTTRQLWAQRGEEEFRSLESEIVVDALRRGGNVVLAAPGGIAEYSDVLEALEQTESFAVWLRADPEVLAQRVAGSLHRPLIGSDPGKLLAAQNASRQDCYAGLAQLIVDVDLLSPAEVADQIVADLPPRF